MKWMTMEGLLTSRRANIQTVFLSYTTTLRVIYKMMVLHIPGASLVRSDILEVGDFEWETCGLLPHWPTESTQHATTRTVVTPV